MESVDTGSIIGLRSPRGFGAPQPVFSPQARPGATCRRGLKWLTRCILRAG